MGFYVGSTYIGSDAPLFVIAGPCVIESLDTCLTVAHELVSIQKQTGVSFIFKASFDKANRSSIDSYRGPGLEKGLDILQQVKQKTGLSVLTDIHEPYQAGPVAQVVDIVQVPAFLCRQTDLLVACAKTGKPVNIKKGQFLSPDEMKNCVNKVHQSGNDKILLTERGTFFGYHRIVNDMTAIVQMQRLGCPVVFDATHSTQRPGGLGNASGGAPEFVPVLARAAIAAGADALFIETHPDPKSALSDAASMLPLVQLKSVVEMCQRIHQLVRRG